MRNLCCLLRMRRKCINNPMTATPSVSIARKNLSVQECALKNIVLAAYYADNQQARQVFLSRLNALPAPGPLDDNAPWFLRCINEWTTPNRDGVKARRRFDDGTTVTLGVYAGTPVCTVKCTDALTPELLIACSAYATAAQDILRLWLDEVVTLPTEPMTPKEYATQVLGEDLD